MHEINTLLLDGAIVDCRDATGKTALHYGVLKSNYYIVSSLLLKGANPFVLDINANSPLYFAYLIKNQMKIFLSENEQIKLLPNLMKICELIETFAKTLGNPKLNRQISLYWHKKYVSDPSKQHHNKTAMDLKEYNMIFREGSIE